MNVLSDFLLMQGVFIGVVLVLHTYLGIHIIRRSLIFSDLALDQMAALGILTGIFLGVSYGNLLSYIFALVFVLVGAFLLSFLDFEKFGIPREATIASVYSLALTASLLMGDKISGGGGYVLKTLTGSLLWTNWGVVAANIIVYLFLLLFHYIYRHKFLALAETRDLKNKKMWEFLFFTTQGIITVLVIPVAGVLLAYSFLMIPAAMSLLITKKWKEGLMIGWGLGFVSCMFGIILSYKLNFPYTPTIMLSMGAFFVLILFFKIVARIRVKGN